MQFMSKMWHSCSDFNLLASVDLIQLRSQVSQDADNTLAVFPGVSFFVGKPLLDIFAEMCQFLDSVHPNSMS